MAFNTPSEGAASHEAENTSARARSSISQKIKNAVTWVFSVHIPKKLQRQGLTQKKFNEMRDLFYEIKKGNLESARAQAMKSKHPFRDTLFAESYAADQRRSLHILDTVIELNDFTDNRDIVVFLRDQLAPLPGVSWGDGH